MNNSREFYCWKKEPNVLWDSYDTVRSHIDYMWRYGTVKYQHEFSLDINLDIADSILFLNDRDHDWCAKYRLLKYLANNSDISTNDEARKLNEATMYKLNWLNNEFETSVYRVHSKELPTWLKKDSFIIGTAKKNL
jgi:hypothetical protein